MDFSVEALESLPLDVLRDTLNDVGVFITQTSDRGAEHDWRVELTLGQRVRNEFGFEPNLGRERSLRDERIITASGNSLEEATRKAYVQLIKKLLDLEPIINQAGYGPPALVHTALTYLCGQLGYPKPDLRRTGEKFGCYCGGFLVFGRSTDQSRGTRQAELIAILILHNQLFLRRSFARLMRQLSRTLLDETTSVLRPESQRAGDYGLLGMIQDDDVESGDNNKRIQVNLPRESPIDYYRSERNRWQMIAIGLVACLIFLIMFLIVAFVITHK